MEGLALESAVVISLIVVVSVALFARLVRLPYTLALVAIGLLIGVLDLVPEIELTPDLILLVFLPPLLFEASYNLDARRLRNDLPAITLLAIPGVILGAFLIAALLAATLDHSFQTTLIFAALITATDPVSVLAIFSKLGAPERLTTIVEGESLFNDGVAIVLYGIVLEAALGGNISVTGGIAEFIEVAFGGAIVGLLIGFFAANLLRRIDDHLIEITITTVVAFGSYTLAETLHISGVIAIVTSGLLVGNLRSVSMSPTTRVALDSFWEYIGFLGNSMIFLLMGMRIAAPDLWDNLPAVGLVIATVIASRCVIVLAVSGVLRALGWGWPWRWTPVVIWGGLRGAVSLALALSLPRSLDDRDWIQVMTFGVVLISLIGQGLTMPPLLARLGFRSEEPDEYERHAARLQAFARAKETIERERRSGVMLPDVADQVSAEYEQAIEKEREQLHLLGAQPGVVRERQIVQAQRQALLVQRDTFTRLGREGQLSADAQRDLIADVDARLIALEEHHDAS